MVPFLLNLWVMVAQMILLFPVIVEHSDFGVVDNRLVMILHFWDWLW
jgi:hypothetical protein